MLETTTITIFLTEMFFFTEKKDSLRTAIIFITREKKTQKNIKRIEFELELDYLLNTLGSCYGAAR